MGNLKLPAVYDQLSRGQKQVARAMYIERQRGRCWYCHENIYSDPPGRVLAMAIDWGQFPRDFLKHPIHLQHNHDTGLTEAVVHAYCNAVLWEYYEI